jgi:aconitase A
VQASGLSGRGVRPADFDNYGARRDHHEVTMRGSFTPGPRVWCLSCSRAAATLAASI